MFDFNKIGDLSKMAHQAKQVQEKQEFFQREQAQLLHKISDQLQEVILLLRNKNQ